MLFPWSKVQVALIAHVWPELSCPEKIISSDLVLARCFGVPQDPTLSSKGGDQEKNSFSS